MKRRLIACILCLAALFLSLPVCAADPPELSATRYAYLYNPQFDTVLYEQNADKVIYPASTVKIMTAILAIEYYRDRTDAKITFTQDMLDLSGGTLISYKLGEVLTVDQLLYGLIVGGGNDAAYALALSISDSVEDFVALMNQKAAALGATNTRFTNPTGVDDNLAYTTVRDLAAIASYAMGMREFLTYSSCERYFMEPTNMVGERIIANRNYLVSRSYISTYYLSYATGLNAGSTVKGGDCCITSATKDGITLVAIVMNASRKEGALVNAAFADVKRMLEWAYANYGYEKVLRRADIVCEIPVDLSATVDYVSLLPKEEVSVYLPSDADPETEIRREYRLYTERLRAPVEEGQEAGEMVLYYKDREVGRVALITKNALARSTRLALLAAVRSTLISVGGLIAGVAILFFLLMLVLANAYLRGRTRRKR